MLLNFVNKIINKNLVMSIFAYTLLYITNISKYHFDFVVNYISKFTQLYQILIWADIFFSQWKEATPDMLMDSKLKCVFEMPADSSSQAPVVKVKAYSHYSNDSFSICHNLVYLFLLKNTVLYLFRV